MMPNQTEPEKIVGLPNNLQGILQHYDELYNSNPSSFKKYLYQQNKPEAFLKKIRLQSGHFIAGNASNRTVNGRWPKGDDGEPKGQVICFASRRHGQGLIVYICKNEEHVNSVWNNRTFNGITMLSWRHTEQLEEFKNYCIETFEDASISKPKQKPKKTQQQKRLTIDPDELANKLKSLTGKTLQGTIGNSQRLTSESSGRTNEDATKNAWNYTKKRQSDESFHDSDSENSNTTEPADPVDVASTTNSNTVTNNEKLQDTSRSSITQTPSSNFNGDGNKGNTNQKTLHGKNQNLLMSDTSNTTPTTASSKTNGDEKTPLLSENNSNHEDDSKEKKSTCAPCCNLF